MKIRNLEGGVAFMGVETWIKWHTELEHLNSATNSASLDSGLTNASGFSCRTPAANSNHVVELSPGFF